MAVYIAAADGVLSSAAAVWGTVDATSYLYSVANNTVLTTSYVESAAFTPGAITIDGIAVHIASRAAVATGTISVRLAQAAATVAGTEVTINVSDIDRPGVITNQAPGLYFFKFAAPVLLVVATAYTVSAKTSSASMVNLYRNATAGNWSRMLRTTTLADAVAGDDWHVLGEYTAAATKTNRTVTMDEVAAVDYGAASTTQDLPAISIGKGGTLTFGVTAATNYVLQVSGNLRVWSGGTLNIGTVGTEIPRDSTATLQFDCGADGDFGLMVDGTFTAKGLSRTSGKNVVQCLLNGDEAAAQTTLSVDTDTGWLSGDIIDIASTTQTFSQSEQRILNGNAAATTLAVTVGLTSAHSGTSPTQAEVILLTRNVIIRSVSTTLMSFVCFNDTSTVSVSWVWFRYLGTATNTKIGLQIQTQAGGSCTVEFCSVSDWEQYGVYIGGTSVVATANITVSGLMMATRLATAQVTGFTLAETTGSSIIIEDVTITAIDGASGDRKGFDIQAAPQAVVSSLRVAGCEGWGMELNTPTSAATLLCGGTFSDFHAHSNQGAGIYMQGNFSVLVTGVQIWRNNTNLSDAGLVITGTGFKEVTTGQIFGNRLNNIMHNGATFSRMKSITVAGDSTFASIDGIEFNGTNTFMFAEYHGCSFGDATGIFVAHTNDINFGGGRKTVDLLLNNCLLDSATEQTNTAVLQGHSVIRHQRVDTATGIHKRVFQAMPGTASLDTVTFRTASPSEKLAPSNAFALVPLESSVFRVRVESGDTVSVAVYGQKDASYSGSAAQLVLRANAALGVNTDTLLDTHSAGITTWEQLTGTTPAASEDGVWEFVVRVYGTGGAFYVDDWSAS